MRMPNRTSAANAFFLISCEVDKYPKSSGLATQCSADAAGDNHCRFFLTLHIGPLSHESVKCSSAMQGAEKLMRVPELTIKRITGRYELVMA